MVEEGLPGRVYHIGWHGTIFIIFTFIMQYLLLYIKRFVEEILLVRFSEHSFLSLTVCLSVPSNCIYNIEVFKEIYRLRFYLNCKQNVLN